MVPELAARNFDHRCLHRRRATARDDGRISQRQRANGMEFHLQLGETDANLGFGQHLGLVLPEMPKKLLEAQCELIVSPNRYSLVVESICCNVPAAVLVADERVTGHPHFVKEGLVGAPAGKREY